MFIDPVFTNEAANKEAHAVQSEYEIDINNDDWMLLNMLTLLCSKEHPMSRFTIGSTETLLARPRAHGLDPAVELKNFHDKYYSANLMSLVIYSSLELDELTR